jgi:hypothetical protein
MPFPGTATPDVRGPKESRSSTRLPSAPPLSRFSAPRRDLSSLRIRSSSGADDGTRTRDPHLGKVMLYQLSHVRVSRQHSRESRGAPGSFGRTRRIPQPTRNTRREDHHAKLPLRWARAGCALRKLGRWHLARAASPRSATLHATSLRSAAGVQTGSGLLSSAPASSSSRSRKGVRSGSRLAHASTPYSR